MNQIVYLTWLWLYVALISAFGPAVYNKIRPTIHRILILLGLAQKPSSPIRRRESLKRYESDTLTDHSLREMSRQSISQISLDADPPRRRRKKESDSASIDSDASFDLDSSVNSIQQRRFVRSIQKSLQLKPPRRKKTLILDLDETLVHSTSRGSRNYDYVVEVLIEKQPYVSYRCRWEGLIVDLDVSISYTRGHMSISFWNRSVFVISSGWSLPG